MARKSYKNDHENVANFGKSEEVNKHTLLLKTFLNGCRVGKVRLLTNEMVLEFNTNMKKQS